MKFLKKLPFIFLLCFNFTQLWATENEELELSKDAVLKLYNLQMRTYEEILNLEFNQNQESLSLCAGVESLLSLSEIPEDLSSSYKKLLSYEKLCKASEEISQNFIKFVLKMSASEFEEFFKKAWIDESVPIRDPAPEEIKAWLKVREEIFANGNSNLPRRAALVKDNFYPYSHFKEGCPKNPYFWLLDEMIRFLLEENSEEKIQNISSFIVILFQKSEFVPLANNKEVQELYFSVWLADIIEWEKSEREKKIKTLQKIFEESESSWNKTASKFIEELYNKMNQEVNSSVNQQKSTIIGKLRNFFKKS